MNGGEPSFKSWCYFVFHEPIVKVPSGYKYLISLNNAEIPNSIYNVNTTNNTVIFGVTDGTTSVFCDPVNITPGTYSAQEICVLLSNVTLTFTAYPSYSMSLKTTYDANLNKFKYTILDSSTSPIANSYLTIPSGNQSPIFGFSGKAITGSNTIGAGAYMYSDICVDVTGTRAVFFRFVNVHTAGFDSKSKISTNILGRIPLSCEPYNILYWQNITHFKTIAQTKNLSVIEIQITDSDGNLVNFNGCDWSASIEINVLGVNTETYQADTNDGVLKV